MKTKKLASGTFQSAPVRAAFAAGCFALLACTAQAQVLDDTRRVAVISAFEPEAKLLLSKLAQRKDHNINGNAFSTGLLEGKPVVTFLSGVSMVNAAMNTQIALDRFRVSHIIFSGIAGGVNPSLHVGDVTVAARWGQYLESMFAREEAPGKFSLPAWAPNAAFANFGMMHPQTLGVKSASDTQQNTGSAGTDRAPRKFWFDVDAGMLKAAEALQNLDLARCNAKNECLTHVPKIVLGGNGVSGQAFVDNKAFREYTFKTFQANVLDMETAATAHVAHANGVPYIAFRSLSDLAGGGDGENEIGTFFQVAADNSAKVVLAYLRAWKP